MSALDPTDLAQPKHRTGDLPAPSTIRNVGGKNSTERKPGRRTNQRAEALLLGTQSYIDAQSSLNVETYRLMASISAKILHKLHSSQVATTLLVSFSLAFSLYTMPRTTRTSTGRTPDNQEGTNYDPCDEELKDSSLETDPTNGNSQNNNNSTEVIVVGDEFYAVSKELTLLPTSLIYSRPEPLKGLGIQLSSSTEKHDVFALPDNTCVKMNEPTNRLGMKLLSLIMAEVKHKKQTFEKGKDGEANRTNESKAFHKIASMVSRELQELAGYEPEEVSGRHYKAL